MIIIGLIHPAQWSFYLIKIAYQENPANILASESQLMLYIRERNVIISRLTKNPLIYLHKNVVELPIYSFTLTHHA